MQRARFQRWSLVLLIITRLLVGETTHAASSAHHASGENPATFKVEPPCPSHASRDSDERVQHVTHDGGARAGEEHEDADCCQTDGCKCPCAQVSVVVPPALCNRLDLTDPQGAFVRTVPVALHRLTALFRPPA